MIQTHDLINAETATELHLHGAVTNKEHTAGLHVIVLSIRSTIEASTLGLLGGGVAISRGGKTLYRTKSIALLH